MPDASTQTAQDIPPTRKPIAATTQKKYDQAIERILAAKLELDDVEKVLDWIKTKGGDSTQKTYLSALKYELGKRPHPFHFPAEYQAEIDRLYGRENEKAEKQELSEKQVSNFVPYERLLAAQKKLADKEDKTEVDWKDYLITSLYTLQPPVRADYANMRVMKTRGKREGNELIWGQKGGAYFVFRDYKTAKTYGNVEVRVSPELHKVLDEYFQHLGKLPTHLLTGIAKDPASLLVAIGSAFFKKTQKHIGINLLRHAYIKHHYPLLESIAKKDTLAKMMLHSREKQEHYNSQNV